MATSSVGHGERRSGRKGGSRKGGSASRRVKAADLCKELGIQAYVLKFWETEFPQLGKRLDEKRLYDAGALEIAREIHRLIDAKRRIADLERENAGLRSRVASPRGESVDPRLVAACLDEAHSLAREADELVRDLLESAGGGEEDPESERSDGGDRSLFPAEG